MKKLLLLTVFMVGLLPTLSLNAMEPTEEISLDLQMAWNFYSAAIEKLMALGLVGKMAEIPHKDKQEFEEALYEVIPVLAHYKIPIQLRNFDPLFYAVFDAPSPNLVRFLIQHGANPNYRTFDGRGLSARSGLNILKAEATRSQSEKLIKEAQEIEKALNGK